MREFAFVKKRNASQPVVGYRSMPMPCVHFQQQTRISRILRSSAIQPRLEISQPDDPCEQEAERRADQVMRMFPAAADLGPTLPSILCRTETAPIQDGREIALQLERRSLPAQEELAQRGADKPWFHVRSLPLAVARATTQLNALPGNGSEEFRASLDTAVSYGQWHCLPMPVRTFFEPRFGYDFSSVRVHVDAYSAEISRQINARAFTFGQDVFFGGGQYAPDKVQGQRLLAHELAHVVQQSGGPASTIRRDEEPTRRQIERDNYLRRLAAWPDEALEAWRRLMPGEQTVVVVYMSGNYGSDFASQFLGYAQSRRRPEPVSHWTNILRESPEELRRRGYRWVVTSMGIEHWVHPSGNSLHRILPSRRSEPRTEPSASSERSPREEQPPQATEEIRENPPHIDPSADPAAAYGPVVQSREGAVIMGQNGRAVEHEDGTILLYPDGARTPVTYRPSPGGYNAYEYYGQDGTKFENLIVAIDPEDVFGVGEGR